MPYEPCLCGSPDCYSCGPMQGYHVHDRHCWGEDGRPECGQLAYDEDPEEESTDNRWPGFRPYRERSTDV